LTELLSLLPIHVKYIPNTMSIERRNFLRNAGLATGLLFFQKPLSSFASITENAVIVGGDATKLLVRHTNDMQGSMPDFLAKSNKGLLLDAGSFLGKTGSLSTDLKMIQEMNSKGYQAVGIGENELAAGQDYLAALLGEMKFPLVNCNYEFSDVRLQKGIRKYVIVYAGPYKIGITGVGAEVKGIRGVQVKDPVAAATAMAAQLKHKMDCDYVICLSHLGYDRNLDVLSNKSMVSNTTHINFVIGGGIQGVVPRAFVVKNKDKQEAILHQGLSNNDAYGHLEIVFNESRQHIAMDPRMIWA